MPLIGGRRAGAPVDARGDREGVRCPRQRSVDDRILLRLPGAVAEIGKRIRALRLPAMAEALVEARLEALVGREAFEQAERHDGPILKGTVGQIGRWVVDAG